MRKTELQPLKSELSSKNNIILSLEDDKAALQRELEIIEAQRVNLVTTSVVQREKTSTYIMLAFLKAFYRNKSSKPYSSILVQLLQKINFFFKSIMSSSPREEIFQIKPALSNLAIKKKWHKLMRNIIHLKYFSILIG